MTIVELERQIAALEIRVRVLERQRHLGDDADVFKERFADGEPNEHGTVPK